MTATATKQIKASQCENVFKRKKKNLCLGNILRGARTGCYGVLPEKTSRSQKCHLAFRCAASLQSQGDA